ncbi:hypothetical protein SLA2020_069260 [Shorea laevis]
MTIIIENSIELGSQVEEQKQVEETKELVLDGGFVVSKSVSNDGFVAPEINSIRQIFRDHNAECERQKKVEEFYRKQHVNQIYDFVKRMYEESSKLNRMEMSILEYCELLNEVVDDTDPDLDEPQIQHLLQSAEAIRKDYPDEEYWLHLTALIHDIYRTQIPSLSNFDHANMGKYLSPCLPSLAEPSLA